MLSYPNKIMLSEEISLKPMDHPALELSVGGGN